MHCVGFRGIWRHCTTYPHCTALEVCTHVSFLHELPFRPRCFRISQPASIRSPLVYHQCARRCTVYGGRGRCFLRTPHVWPRAKTPEHLAQAGRLTEPPPDAQKHDARTTKKFPPGDPDHGDLYPDIAARKHVAVTQVILRRQGNKATTPAPLGFHKHCPSALPTPPFFALSPLPSDLANAKAPGTSGASPVRLGQTAPYLEKQGSGREILGAPDPWKVTFVPEQGGGDGDVVLCDVGVGVRREVS